jgi:coenzyme F420 hydrogenase subunit beta
VWLEPREASQALKSQANLIRKRGAVWGRVLALRSLGLPVPRLRGFSLFANWLRLPFVEKLQATLGTVRRIVQRGWWRPLRFDAADVVRRSSPSPAERALRSRA